MIPIQDAPYGLTLHTRSYDHVEAGRSKPLQERVVATPRFLKRHWKTSEPFFLSKLDLPLGLADLSRIGDG